MVISREGAYRRGSRIGEGYVVGGGFNNILNILFFSKTKATKQNVKFAKESGRYINVCPVIPMNV